MTACTDWLPAGVCLCQRFLEDPPRPSSRCFRPVPAMADGNSPRAVLPGFGPGLSRLAKSLSKDNLESLQRVSSTLQNVSDIKRSGDLLLLTAQQATANEVTTRLKSSLTQASSRLSSSKLAEDFALIKHMGAAERKLAPKRAGMRRSQSDNDFRRPAWPRVGSPTKHQSSSMASEGESWDLLSALNNTLSQARTGSQPVLRLPTSFEEQAKQLVHNASTNTLTQQLLQKPRDALSSCQQTLETCQANLLALQQNLQLSLAESATRLQSLTADAGPGAGPGSGAAGGMPPALGSLLNLRRLSEPGPGQQPEQQEAAAGGQQQQQVAWGAWQSDEDPTSPWAVLPGYLRAKEIAAIEDLITDEEAGEAEQPKHPLAQLQQRLTGRWAPPKGSSLREDGRQIAIVTTASLPWMTGTAVNPLLRAAYLAKDKARKVTLMIPWLAKSDQSKIFPNNLTFDTPDEQEKYVREWVKKRTGFESDFKVTFYPGRYAPEKCSILPVGDPTQYVPDHEADVAILEEPEHLNWFHHGTRWTDKFNHVVGVVHTNYLDYARREEGGSVKETLLRHINNWVCRAYCHKVVKLSDAVQPLPKQTTEFVHGVAENFLDVGRKKAQPPEDGKPRFSKGAYFLGKVVWAKGYTELLELLSAHHKSAEAKPIHLDCYGTGEDLEAVREEAAKRNLKVSFHGAKDHLDESIHDYMVFVNPSTSDVVATTSAEALAMGKWVICAEHPSNRFFSSFRNCLIFRTPQEFSQHLEHALKTEPHPMSAEEVQSLTWEAATERFLDVTELQPHELRPGPLASTMDTVLWAAHNTLTGIEPVRMACGSGANTRDNPQRLVDYDPTTSVVGGIFDDKKRLSKSPSGGTVVAAVAPATAAAP